MPIQGMLDNIELLCELHNKLLALEERKKTVIINNELSELTLILSNESRILKEIDKVETARQEIGYEIIRAKGIKTRLELTVSEISRLVFEPEEKRRLLKAREELVDLLAKLKQVNELNQNLISQSLSFIDYSLNLFIGGDEYDAVYTRPDQSQATRGPQRTGIFEARA